MKTKLGLETLEQREVPATLYWVNTDTGSTYHASSDTNNWATSSGGSTHPSSAPGGSDKIVFDGNGIGRCELSQQNFGAMDITEDYGGKIKTCSTGLVLNGTEASTWRGTIDTFRNTNEVKLLGDLTVYANSLTIRIMDMSLATGDATRNIVVNNNATLNVIGVNYIDHNVVNYGNLNFGDNSLYSLVNVTYDGVTRYIYNDTDQFFTWKGASWGVYGHPDYFYLENKGITVTTPMTYNGVTTAELDGAMYNHLGLLSIRSGLFDIRGWKSYGGSYTNLSLFSDSGIINHYTDADVKISRNAYILHSSYNMKWFTGGDYSASFTTDTTNSTLITFDLSTWDMRGSTTQGIILNITGSSNLFVTLYSTDLYMTVHFQGSVNKWDRINMPNLVGNNGPGDVNTIHVYDQGTPEDGIFTLIDCEYSMTDFYAHDLQGNFAGQFLDGLHDYRVIRITGGGGE